MVTPAAVAEGAAVAVAVWIVQAVLAARRAVAAVNVIVAPACVLASTAVAKVVVPQPVVVGAALPVRIHEGRTTAIVSPTAIWLFNLKAIFTVAAAAP